MLPLDFVLAHIIDPVLDLMEPHDPGVRSESARFLVLGTMLKESDHFRTRHQYGDGPARSLAQIERATFNDVMERYFGRNFGMRQALGQLCGNGATGAWSELAGEGHADNDWVAAMICRAIYRYRPGKLPEPRDAVGMGVHWKRYYNTIAGKGRHEDFTQLYRDYVLPMIRL